MHLISCNMQKTTSISLKSYFQEFCFVLSYFISNSIPHIISPKEATTQVLGICSGISNRDTSDFLKDMQACILKIFPAANTDKLIIAKNYFFGVGVGVYLVKF